jgi:hypothetical protein
LNELKNAPSGAFFYAYSPEKEACFARHCSESTAEAALTKLSAVSQSSVFQVQDFPDIAAIETRHYRVKRAFQIRFW